MEAQTASELPSGPDWQYEPKWDGFRCLAFRDGKKITLQSKSGKPLTRYFPELVAALLDLSPRQFVLDGEIVIALDGALSFEHLLMRIHPAPSRILKLSQSTPCTFLVFDLLVNERGKSLTEFPLSVRRKELEGFAKRYLKRKGLIRLSPATPDLAKARKWFATGNGLDGIIAKRRDMSYQLANGRA
jgi:ATP-dependent DNA ligase